jgi:signal peptidase
MDVELQPRSVLACELVTDVVRNFGEARLKVTGASMIPAIWPGDVITIRRRGVAELQSGQIVLSRRGGMLVAHRITCIRGHHVITRGDSLQHDDPPVRPSDIVGEVVSIVRNGCQVRPRQSFRQRFVSSVLRRSDFCMRMALRLGPRLRRTGRREISWAS